MRQMTFFQVAEMLKEIIRNLDLPKEGELGTSAILKLIAVLEKKPHSLAPKKAVIKSAWPHLKPGDEIERPLRICDENQGEGELEMERDVGEILEEDRHPWMMPKKTSPEVTSAQSGLPATMAPNLYLRVWDDKSQARIREGNEGFLSGSNYMPLHTKEQRKTAIQKHANWGNREKTAFISTTTDIKEITEHRVPLLEKRQRKNGLLSVTKITLINGNADGMPVLRMRKELDFYRCRIPYQNREEDLPTTIGISSCVNVADKVVKETKRELFFANEYLFLFRIPPDQIVKTWLWKDVEQWLAEHESDDIHKWYREVLVPAYNRHEHKRTSGSVEGAHEPNCTCCGH